MAANPVVLLGDVRQIEKLGKGAGDRQGVLFAQLAERFMQGGLGGIFLVAG